jgi:hypothetical protein
MIPTLAVLLLVFAICPLASAQIPGESHLSEPVSGVVFTRSAFAHGYRHGYEEGYHLGNLDINMGRLVRVKKGQFRGVNLGYSSSFGSRRSFEAGFHAGLGAGYADGYDGRTFRAVELVRSVAAELKTSPSPADPAGLYFDQGLGAGYYDGLQQGKSAPADFHAVSCAQFHPEKREDLPAEGSYCEGYQRGFVLGRSDALALANRPALEASK